MSVHRLHNRDAARAILDGIGNEDFDAGIRAGLIPLPVNGLWSSYELDICRRRIVEARQRERCAVRPTLSPPPRIARAFKERG